MSQKDPSQQPEKTESDELAEDDLDAVNGGAAFAKYDGIDGESKDSNPDKWIDVLSIDWGSNKPGGGATGATRRRK